MASYNRRELTCCFCGKVSAHEVLIGVTTFGGATPDLDTRPGEMKRSTMASWLQSCPSCGYVAGDLSHVDNPTTDAVAALVRSPEYQSLIDGSRASPFLRMVMIADAVKDVALAAQSALGSAWVADDAGDDEAASSRRLSAAKRFRTIADEVPRLRDQTETLLVDVLRRAGCFDEAIAFADAVLAREPKDLLAKSPTSVAPALPKGIAAAIL